MLSPEKELAPLDSFDFEAIIKKWRFLETKSDSTSAVLNGRRRGETEMHDNDSYVCILSCQM